MGTARRSLFGLLALVAFGAGLAPWFVADDIVAEVANQEPVLLGRYALDGFARRAFLITPLCWVAALVFWARRTRSHQYVLFRLGAISFALLVALIVVDVTGRALRKEEHLPNTTVAIEGWPAALEEGARPPNVRYEIRLEDLPPAARSYPYAPPGRPLAEVVLTTDERGCRNAHALPRCDIVTIGGAATEGYGVDDARCWPAVLSNAIAEPVYNLGLTGAGPTEHLRAFAEVALELEPKVVILMLTEGEAFAALTGVPEGVELAEPVNLVPPSPIERFGAYLASSPVTLGIRNGLRSWCGSVRKDELLLGWAPLEWMPIRLVENGKTNAYAFTPAALRAHHTPRETIEASAGWTHLRAVLATITRMCRERGARLLVALAPSKVHVLLPLVEGTIPTDGLAQFAQYGEGPAIADPEAFRRTLFERLEAREQVIEAWCRANGVPFVSVTQALRARMRAGEPVYRTYDPHWTAAAHAVAARRVLVALQG